MSCRILLGSGLGGPSIHIIKSDLLSPAGSELNHSRRYVWWDCLPFLVVRDVSLSHADAGSEGCLGKAEFGSDSKNWLHKSNSATSN